MSGVNLTVIGNEYNKEFKGAVKDKDFKEAYKCFMLNPQVALSYYKANGKEVFGFLVDDIESSLGETQAFIMRTTLPELLRQDMRKRKESRKKLRSKVEALENQCKRDYTPCSRMGSIVL